VRTVSFFHKETGALHSNQLICSDDAAVALNTPADHIAIDGHHDYLCKRVDLETKQIVEWIPPAPSADHVWNPETLRWQLSAAAQGKAQARQLAQARIAALRASSIDVMRELLLGNESARARLQAIADEIEMQTAL
jgi:hypothetical protein